MRLIFAAAVVAAMAACNQDDSANVMAPSGNSLTPAQVDAALGPEIVEAGNESVDANNGVNETEANNVQETTPVNTNSNAEQ
ncbi:MAG: hypothetical protein H0W39_09355 [Sphingomonas sp.]|nr:hypothetical protein [Sphingomonas sp.]